MKKHILTYLIALLNTVFLHAQSLDYGTYMRQVLAGNADYRAIQLEVPIAQSELRQASAHNNPSLSVSYGNNSDWDIAMGQSMEVELSKSFSLGKRHSRRAVARANVQTQEAGLLDYERNLRADATIAYLEALLARETARTQQEYADNMTELYRSDSLRFSRGDLSAVDVAQSHLEAEVAQQACRSAQTAYRNALAHLDWLMGDPLRGTSEIEGQLTLQRHVTDLPQLLRTCIGQRPDVAQAQHQYEGAKHSVRLTQMERTPDIDLSVGFSHNTRVNNEEAPAPPFNGYTVGLSLPLPVSNLNRGEVQAQRHRAMQAQIQVEAAQQAATAEVMEAYNNYITATALADAYSKQILEQAQQVLDGKMYAYKRGETSLLEVLNAQHTYMEIRQEYNNSLCECAKCWVELNRSTGSLEYGL